MYLLYYSLYFIYLTHQDFKEKNELILLNVLNRALSEIRKISRSSILLMGFGRINKPWAVPRNRVVTGR